MIEIFKTNVEYPNDAKRVVALLKSKIKGHHINFDLDDCDRILRIETTKREIAVARIKQVLQNEGFRCEVLCD